jgi:hypothetical protein
MNRPTMTPPTFGNVFEDMFEVLWAPSTVFERSRYRTFGKYMLVLFLVCAVVTVISAKLTGPWLDATFDLSMQQAAARGQNIPPEAMASARKFGSIGFYFTPLFVVVMGGFFGGLMLLLGGKIVQAPITYGQAVLIAVLGSMPRTLGLLASGVMGLVLDGEKARSLYDLSIGPARFLDPTKVSPVLMQLLAGVDLFNLWQLVIFGVGVAVAAKVSKSTGFVAALVAWVLGTAIPLLPTLLTR